MWRVWVWIWPRSGRSRKRHRCRNGVWTASRGLGLSAMRRWQGPVQWRIGRPKLFRNKELRTCCNSVLAVFLSRKTEERQYSFLHKPCREVWGLCLSMGMHIWMFLRLCYSWHGEIILMISLFQMFYVFLHMCRCNGMINIAHSSVKLPQNKRKSDITIHWWSMRISVDFSISVLWLWKARLRYGWGLRFLVV